MTRKRFTAEDLRRVIDSGTAILQGRADQLSAIMKWYDGDVQTWDAIFGDLDNLERHPSVHRISAGKSNAWYLDLGKYALIIETSSDGKYPDEWVCVNWDDTIKGKFQRRINIISLDRADLMHFVDLETALK